nr:immunoglobulin heavy chain junction region [Macaca mulatta]
CARVVVYCSGTYCYTHNWFDVW